MPIPPEAANVSPFVSKMLEMESLLDDSQKAKILSQVDCFAKKCPCSAEMKPYHEKVTITG